MSDSPPNAFLDALPPLEREQVEAGMLRERYPAGGVILREGDLSSDFFIVLSGRVEIERRGDPVAVILAGDVFGESGAVDPGPGYELARNATVRAGTDIELGILDETLFAQLFQTSDAFRHAIHDRLTTRSQ
jgi:CRP-like cAMP-binding protein